MRPKLWMILTWAGIIVVVAGICAVYGGRNCEVPKSGPLRELLAGHQYIVRHAGRYACTEVK